MKKRLGTLFRTALALAGAMTLAACGGGDSTAPITAVTVLKELGIALVPGVSAREIGVLKNAQVEILEIRCGYLRAPPGVTAPSAVVTFLLLDIPARDAVKAKALGYLVFGPEEQARKTGLAVCP